MIAFDDGYFLRSWKHGGHDWDPAWVAAEKTTVNACAAAILGRLPGMIQIVGQQLMQAHSILPYVQNDGAYMRRWHLWLTRMGATMKMFTDMQADLGTGGKTITLRKATDMAVADQISALCEFSGKSPRWVISVNGNPKDTACYFFAKANAAKATQSLFHELTHLYGTEDSGVMDIENAHRLEPLMGRNGGAVLRRLLAKQRQFTLMGDTNRFTKGAVVTMSRLIAAFGPGNSWNATDFAKAFTGNPVNGNVKRNSDGKIGNISIIWDANNQPLYYYNFN